MSWSTIVGATQMQILDKVTDAVAFVDRNLGVNFDMVSPKTPARHGRGGFAGALAKQPSARPDDDGGDDDQSCRRATTMGLDTPRPAARR